MISPIISIIVPVYKVEKYLRQCLDSILVQTFEDWECILVDDGSPDNSGCICDEYAKNDSRFRVIHKENGGVSSARNVGLDNARGEWVYFSDADDELLVDSIETLVSGIRISGIDIVQAGFIKVKDTIVIESQLLSRTCVLDNVQAIKQTYKSDYYSYQGYLWTKLFKKDKINMYNIRFDEDVYYDEDSLFIVEFLVRTKSKMFFTTKPVYKYIIRDSSAMSNLCASFNIKQVTVFNAYVNKLNIIKSFLPNEKELIHYAKIRCLNVFFYVIKLMKNHNSIDYSMLIRMFIKLYKSICFLDMINILKSNINR